jgi:protein SCO1/2
MKRLPPILLLAFCACSARHKLEIYGQIPEFQLTSQDGETFNEASLKGHVWIADFIYTTCPGPCPRMSSQMSALQKATAGTPDIRLVSLTVDPAHDTPPVLAAYAVRYQANPARWSFLTGKQETLQLLSRDAFKLSDVDSSMNHSTRFVLVDQKGRIRGYYGTMTGDPVKQIAADARQLREETSS